MVKLDYSPPANLRTLPFPRSQALVAVIRSESYLIRIDVLAHLAHRLTVNEYGVRDNHFSPLLPFQPADHAVHGQAVIRLQPSPMRQWVPSVPFPLRFLFACKPKVMGKVLSIVYRTIATHLTRKAGYTKATAQAGAVTLIQCFGGCT